MEIIFDFLKIALQGIMRELAAYLFRKMFLENKKTTYTNRQKGKGGFHK